MSGGASGGNRGGEQVQWEREKKKIEVRVDKEKDTIRSFYEKKLSTLRTKLESQLREAKRGNSGGGMGGVGTGTVGGGSSSSSSSSSSSIKKTGRGGRPAAADAILDGAGNAEMIARLEKDLAGRDDEIRRLHASGGGGGGGGGSSQSAVSRRHAWGGADVATEGGGQDGGAEAGESGAAVEELRKLHSMEMEAQAKQYEVLKKNTRMGAGGFRGRGIACVALAWA